MANEINRYTTVRARGVVFRFKHDVDAPDLLHIWVRHLTTPRDAINTFFTATEDEWDERRRCWVTRNDTHEITWFWIVENVRVMIITCITRRD